MDHLRSSSSLGGSSIPIHDKDNGSSATDQWKDKSGRKEGMMTRREVERVFPTATEGNCRCFSLADMCVFMFVVVVVVDI